MSNLAYRKDLDGLRALAILPVLFFHFDFSWFSGGYVGVDVFFVLSGYLISSILIKEINNKEFSFFQFFNRRIRRLMPMAFTIYIFCLLVFLFIYPNVYYQKVTDAVLTSMLFTSNLYFWQQGGYFTGAFLEINPLLHTWSLSVEEQFYLFFPIFLIVLFKITTSSIFRFLAICILTLISLFLAVQFAPSYQSFAAFYLLPPRMYELSIGAIFAYLIIKMPNNNCRNLPGIKELGFVMILVPIFLFDKNTTFPSYNALMPVLGAAFIIFSNNKNNIINKLLTNKLIVYIGLISYSLYLWHWPLIVIKNWVYPNAAFLVDFLTICLCFILSALSYRYIEKPFRNKDLIPGKILVIIASASFALLFCITLILSHYGNSFIVDNDRKIELAYLSATVAEPNRGYCTDKIRNTNKFHYCEWQSDNLQAKNIFVWGDSHGSALMPAFELFKSKYNIRFTHNTGCPPFPNIERNDNINNCVKINNLVLEHINNEKYDMIIFAAAFNNYLNLDVLKSMTTDGQDKSKASIDIFGFNANSLFFDLKKKKQNFIIISQAPRFEKDVSLNFLRESTLKIKSRPLFISIDEYHTQSEDFYTAINKEWHKYIFTLDRVYCPNNICISQRGAELLYKDAHHITNAFAKEIGVNLEVFVSEQIDSNEKK
jgi:peptidoglycan/LPS O-acetylase OafA/YrhL